MQQSPLGRPMALALAGQVLKACYYGGRTHSAAMHLMVSKRSGMYAPGGKEGSRGKKMLTC
jgi:hypothetical protein